MKKIDKTIIIGVNLGDFGSTGDIMRNTLEYASKVDKYDYLIIVPKKSGRPNLYSYKDKGLNLFQKFIYHRLAKQPTKRPDGFFETPYTKRIIRKIKEKSKKYKNCFVHLNNIHMANIDLRILFKFLKKNRNVTRVFYTLHDEWPYTGGCYCANYSKCTKWKTGCYGNCPQNYGKPKFSVAKQWLLKKKYTLLIRDKLVLIPVSRWLENNVKCSFLQSVKTIVNYGETSLNPEIIDQNFLYSIKNKLKLNDKRIVLAVSAYWNEWKGIKYLFQVAEKLPSNYVLLVVGGKIPQSKKIIHINNVEQNELAAYYALADVYISVSQCEALGLTTCEAQMCGTPVVAFGHTAIKETIIQNESGIVVGEDNNIDKMIKAIIQVAENKPFVKEKIIASGQRFKKYEHAKRMIEIYNDYNN